MEKEPETLLEEQQALCLANSSVPLNFSQMLPKRLCGSEGLCLQDTFRFCFLTVFVLSERGSRRLF